MDIKELDKKQLILLVLLITFVVSIATGIVTVSLMNQMPKSVPQTVNNVIQRTIEKVTTVEVPSVNNEYPTSSSNTINESSSLLSGNSDTLIDIYINNVEVVDDTKIEASKAIGQGIIISDIGLILVDSNLINDSDSYRVVLDKIDFSASILKKFNNGFTILKISTIEEKPIENPELPIKTE